MNFSRLNKILIVFVLISSLFSFQIRVFAQGSDFNLPEFCPQLTENIDQVCNSLGTAKCHQALKECEAYYEKKSQSYQAEVNQLKTKEKSLRNQVYYLSTKIKDLNYQIYKNNLVIKDLNLQINNTQGSIEKTTENINSMKRKLADILELIYEEDQKSSFEIFFTEKNLSNFFDNLIALESLNFQLQNLLKNIKDLKSNLENQKESMSQEKEELEALVTSRALQLKESSSLKSEQEYILAKTKGQESLYQQYIKEVEKRAAKIRAKIFELAGDVKAPTFGQAIEIANMVCSQINIRPAFLLAVLSQESRIGQNVGRCYVTNSKTGGGVYSNGTPAPRIMNPARDLPIFLSLMARLGYDFSKKPVSCWIKAYYRGKPYGWGGAMGPAQFIPSTWRLMESDIAKYTGKTTPDPWNIKDAFVAAALYLYKLGARPNSGEYQAAYHYYGGSNSYAKQVSSRAWCIQQFIDRGAMSTECQNLLF